MSLTRRFLKELELTDYAIEKIITAHAETVDALRTERDAAVAATGLLEQAAAERDTLRETAQAHQREAERLRSEYDAYRQEVGAARTDAQRHTALCDALTRAGANAQAIPLLVKAITTTDDDWNGAALRDESAVLTPIREQYAPFFTQVQPLPTDPVSPPLDGSALTFEDVRCMSAEEINRNWSQVCSALTQRS